MDRAFNTVTQSIEYAYQIKQRGDAYVRKHKEHYQCANPYCRMKAIPCACKQKRLVDGVLQDYKQQPHFKFPEHIQSCIFSKNFGGEWKTDGKGNKTWVLPYVTEITHPNSKGEPNKLKNGQSSPKPNGQVSSTGQGTGADTSRTYQRSSYVSAAALFYLQDPITNGELALTLLGKKKTYRALFQELREFKNVRYKDEYIFYKALRYLEEPIYTKDYVSIQLFQKEPHTGEFFELRLNWSDWSNRHREAIKSELVAALNAARTSSKQDKLIPTAFFIGKQDSGTRNIFHCDLAEFFFLHVGKPVDLPFNKFGMEEENILVKSQEPAATEPLVGEARYRSLATAKPTTSEVNLTPQPRLTDNVSPSSLEAKAADRSMPKVPLEQPIHEKPPEARSEATPQSRPKPKSVTAKKTFVEKVIHSLKSLIPL
ncbi:hypothetical protein F0223_08265 [Vibrio coralliilyticus]|uniref:hypothetical protein n=1 Tax=Vibrio coralliilyticus TaxID=190893 RepID=UPI00148DBC1A|nr:hypothetical protein [Vibrio coralliilyticus]NOI18221.1 hypothetical protein [Vibrio coralliilyticus]